MEKSLNQAIVLTLGILMVTSIVYAAVYDKYKVNTTSVIKGLDANDNVVETGLSNIDKFGVCKQVTNNSGSSIFIPAKTAAEWASVYSHPPAGVTFSDCGGATCLPYYANGYNRDNPPTYDRDLGFEAAKTDAIYNDMASWPAVVKSAATTALNSITYPALGTGGNSGTTGTGWSWTTNVTYEPEVIVPVSPFYEYRISIFKTVCN